MKQKGIMGVSEENAVGKYSYLIICAISKIKIFNSLFDLKKCFSNSQAFAVSQDNGITPVLYRSGAEKVIHVPVRAFGP
jgi:hypothetical protein